MCRRTDRIDLCGAIALGTALVVSSHSVVSVGRASVELEERLRREDRRVVAEVKTVIVMWDPAQPRTRLVPEAERTALLGAR